MTKPLIFAALGICAMLAASTGPASASATDDVRAAMRKFAGLNSFEMVSQSKGKTTTIDVINRPAAMRVASEGMEMVNVGDSTYMKMGGSWRKFPSSRHGSGNGLMENPVRHFADKANNLTATDLGMKPMAGGMYHVYRVTDNSDSSSSGTVYVGLDGLPHRFESKDGNGVTLTKFNSVAPIRAPM